MMNRKGFTLIELLIVVVIIGILAAIAIPKFANTKEKAVVASMKSDLRNLVTAQESFFSDNQDYAGSRRPDDPDQRHRGRRQGGLRFVRRQRAGGQVRQRGWLVGTVTNPAVKSATSDECGIFVGTAATYPNARPVKTEGAPACY